MFLLAHMEVALTQVGIILILATRHLAYQAATQTASMVTLNMHHHQDIMHYVLKD
jgi:hypothetical protein